MLGGVICVCIHPKRHSHILVGCRRGDDNFFGIYHYANDGEVTWFEFAQKIRDLSGLSCELRPIPASDYPSKVQRPTYSVLSTKKIQHIFGIAISDWDKSLIDFFERV